MLKRWVVLTAVAAAILATIALWYAASALVAPARARVGEPPSDLAASSVRIPTAGSDVVVGWLIRGEAGIGAVMLLHGVRANRLEMLGRARFLARAGYSVLLIDLPGHGESSGEKITFGARESAGVTAALKYLRQELPGERIGVIGVSLGAASLVLSRARPAPDAAVLESMYPTIEEATQDRLAIRFGPASAKLAPFLYWQLRLRIGVSTKDLRPIDSIAALGCPLLIASGSEDRHTTWRETQRIYSRALSPKELWEVEGAAHVNLHQYAPQEYERRVLEFFARHVRSAN